MKTTALIVLAGIAGAASAQNIMTMSWSVGDTGNNDGIIEPGESALLTLSATMNPGRTGYAGSIFDVIGVGNWATGSVDSYTNLVDSLATGPGDLQGNNDITGIESFQLPPFFNPSFKAGNPIAIYSITWTPNDYTARLVTLTSANHANFSVYTDTFGTSVEYTGDVQRTAFEVVPAPASLALLGLGGLVARRRR
jgi:hypothetical protein